MSKVVVLGSWPESLLNFRGHLLANMVAQGHEVHAMAPGYYNDIVDALSEMGVHYHDISLKRIGLNPFRDLQSLIHIYRALVKLQPDYVLTYTIKPVIYGSIAARMAGVPNIYSMITGVGYAFQNESMLAKLVGMVARGLFRISLKYNKRVFFQNRDNLKTFQMSGLLKKQDQSVLINGSGVDLDHFSPAPYPQGVSFLMIARLLKDKGVYEYVEAARRIKENNPGLEFRLIGWIDDNPDAISNEDLKGWVREGVIDYMGYVNDVRSAIAGSSVYVLPSYHEGMPRTVLEAMAMGRPIITTDVPGCRETVEEGKNGFLVQAKEVSSLEEAMLRFADNPDLIPVMGESSLSLVKERFDVHDVNKDILETMGLMSEASV